jgi:UDP-glucose:(heptosyl)LPS alpha-1,3-glucosyltransferase
MKIAIARKTYAFHGGAEGFTAELVRRLAALGHEVHIFAISWEGAPEGVPVHHIHAPRLSSFLRDLVFAVATARELRRGGFDIVQAHDKCLYQDVYRAGDGCHAAWLAERRKRATLAVKLSIVLNPYHRLILAIESAILRGHRFRKVIAISELVKNNLMEYYAVPEKDIAVMYNGVDLDRFHPRNRKMYRAEVRQRHGIAEDENVALFVGSGFERKGVPAILRALDLVDSPMTVLVVGRGRGRAYRSPDGTRRVIYAGPRRDVEAYYGAADFFVFPTMYEPFGNVHLEAMASGLPVITTRLAGGAEIIEHGIEGFVVDAPESTVEIARAMDRLADPGTRASMGGRARAKAEQFTFDRHIGETLALWRSVIDEKSRA